MKSIITERIEAQTAHGGDSSHQRSFQEGWNAALNSEAVQNLIDALRRARGNLSRYGHDLHDIDTAISEYMK